MYSAHLDKICKLRCPELAKGNGADFERLGYLIQRGKKRCDCHDSDSTLTRAKSQTSIGNGAMSDVTDRELTLLSNGKTITLGLEKDSLLVKHKGKFFWLTAWSLSDTEATRRETTRERPLSTSDIRQDANGGRVMSPRDILSREAGQDTTSRLEEN